MARDINLYVADPASTDIDLGKYEGRVKIRALAGRKVKPGPVIMVREPRPDPIIMDLEVPQEIQLEIEDPSELDDKVLEPIVKAVDAGDHKLTIVQVEHLP
jgi:hypothetical protein